MTRRGCGWRVDDEEARRVMENSRSLECEREIVQWMKGREREEGRGGGEDHIVWCH